MAHSEKKSVPVVSILNMKGGVGKTTITAHVFRLFYLHKKRSTLLIDFDPQFNLTQTVITQSKYEKLKESGSTILNVMEPIMTPSIFTVCEETTPPPLEKDISVDLKYIIDTEIKLSIIPGDFRMVKYSLIDNVTTLVPVKRRFLDFIEKSKEDRGLICIDCNPSSSFMTECAIRASTHILVPVKPDRYSLLGLEMLKEYISNLPGLTIKPKLIVLLNGIPSSGYNSAIEDSLRSHPDFGPITMVNTLGVSKLLEATSDYTGFATDKKVAHRWRLTNRIRAIVDELAGHLGV